MRSYWYRAETLAAATKHHLEYDLVRAVIEVESSGHTDAYRYEPAFWARYLANKPEWQDQNPRRVSASYGLMQVMYVTAVELGLPKGDPPEALFVPVRGLEWGCRALAERLAWAKGNARKAVAAYNGGKGNWDGVRPQAHADKVMAALARVRAGQLE